MRSVFSFARAACAIAAALLWAAPAASHATSPATQASDARAPDAQPGGSQAESARPSPASPPGAAPSPPATPSQTGASCTGAIDTSSLDDQDPLAVFARPLLDPPTLRAVAAIVASSTDVQARVANMKASAVTPTVASAVVTHCLREDVFNAAARAALEIQQPWDGANIVGHEAAVETTILNAVAAVRARRDLAPDEVAAALAPFGLTVATLAPAPQPAPSPCSEPNTDPHLISQAPLSYPPEALASRSTGVFQVKVVLDRYGLLNSALMYRVQAGGAVVELGTDPARLALAREAVLVAARSTFAPAAVHCITVPSTVLFHVEFGDKPQ